MRAAFVTAEVLADAGAEAGVSLRRLAEDGLQPVVLAPRPVAPEDRPESGGFPFVACPPGDTACWGDPPELLLEAATVAGVAVGEAFLVGAEPADVERGMAAGCRPVLVLAGRTLDAVYGPEEPAHKEMAVATDLASAVRFMASEADQERQLGTFAHAPHPVLDEVPRAASLSRGDLLRVFALITVAGVAVALGIAYWLQELYQNFRFPAVFYYLTLQSIPQWLRGALFILVGIGIGFMVPRLVRGFRARRRYGA